MNHVSFEPPLSHEVMTQPPLTALRFQCCGSANISGWSGAPCRSGGGDCLAILERWDLQKHQVRKVTVVLGAGTRVGGLQSPRTPIKPLQQHFRFQTGWLPSGSPDLSPALDRQSICPLTFLDRSQGLAGGYRDDWRSIQGCGEGLTPTQQVPEGRRLDLWKVLVSAPSGPQDGFAEMLSADSPRCMGN
ncbi:hypothetical protein P7K49_003009 [Saguinus oedipus]|uniref:Uncharacterized protein n=1 Tax=Saguinus oedipus TaxID=9490 RepID=A0ABQ9WIY7_SAGOE|nr:hypothetical protein P7K49_003009 [Saguinus oedipus]